jgi:hypothetical protein
VFFYHLTVQNLCNLLFIEHSCMKLSQIVLHRSEQAPDALDRAFCCEISGSEGGEHEGHCLLGCCAV